MRLGANSVLFGGHPMEAAFKYLKLAGYDGIEISAIDGMGTSLDLNNWREAAPEIKRLAGEYELELPGDGAALAGSARGWSRRSRPPSRSVFRSSTAAPAANPTTRRPCSSRSTRSASWPIWRRSTA